MVPSPAFAAFLSLCLAIPASAAGLGDLERRLWSEASLAGSQLQVSGTPEAPIVSGRVPDPTALVRIGQLLQRFGDKGRAEVHVDPRLGAAQVRARSAGDIDAIRQSLRRDAGTRLHEELFRGATLDSHGRLSLPDLPVPASKQAALRRVARLCLAQPGVRSLRFAEHLPERASATSPAVPAARAGGTNTPAPVTNDAAVHAAVDLALAELLTRNIASLPQASEVRVSVLSGVATLSGSVGQAADRELLRKVLLEFRGVESVADALVVREEAPGDGGP